MTAIKSEIQFANIQWLDSGEPYSRQFDDIYFSRSDGLRESQYVFLQQNGLPERWGDKSTFSIGELGFGSGLNFLATLDAWFSYLELSVSEIVDAKVSNPKVLDPKIPNTKVSQMFASSQQKLSYTSLEQFPFTLKDYHHMAELLQNRWPHLQLFHTQIQQLYPINQSAVHLSLFEGLVELNLYFQNALDCMTSVDLVPSMPKMDAWYLDGFDPRKNESLWNQNIYQQLAQHSHPDATFSTYTAAGHVRRGMIEAGFNVAKQKGFGQKKEMLIGQLVRSAN